MITLKTSKTIQKWFANKPNIGDMLSFISYNQVNSIESYFGFIRQDFYTYHLNLTKNIDDIFNNIKKNTKYEINRAKREGVKFAIHNDIEYFINYYNKFANLKGLSSLRLEDFKSMTNNLIITKALSEDENIYIMHSYLCDEESGIVRLLHSASFYETDDNKISKRVGMANRMLHFDDVVYFKEQGYKIYDFGGYANNTTDKHLQNINDFKAAFGGNTINQSHYYSILLYIALKLKNMLSR